MCRTPLVVAVLFLALSASAVRADDSDRQRLLALFNKLQDALLTVNAEIIQYGERVNEMSAKLRERSIWDGEEIDKKRLLPTVHELNRVKSALGLIGTGLEQKYAQIRSFQEELRERYPGLRADIDTYYATFDRVYESSRARHQRTTAQMDDLRQWLKQQIATHSLSDDGDDEPAPPRRSRGGGRARL